MSESLEEFNAGRLLTADELALLQREPYHMFKPIEISNAELCAMWLNDEIPLSEYMKNFKESPKPRENKS